MKIVKKHLNGNQYYPRQYKKETIFLHHTAGTSAEGALNWWNQTPAHVGTAYVIDRDGTIYEAFPPECYAFHLGIKGDDNHHEKHSINIEIVSAGQLYKEGDDHVFYPLFPKKIVRQVIPSDEVLELDWKGYKYFHKYTDEQIESTVELVKYLVDKFGIELQKDLSDFFEYDESVITEHKKGLFSHTTVRKDKVDVFPQPNFMKAIIKNFMKLPKVRGIKPEKIGTIKSSTKKKKK